MSKWSSDPELIPIRNKQLGQIRVYKYKVSVLKCLDTAHINTASVSS